MPTSFTHIFLKPRTMAASKGSVAAFPTSSIAEAARSKYSVGNALQAIPIELLGTVPWNRGKLGVSSFHVHRVVASIRADGLSQHRYRDATVVKVPAHALDEFRKFNKDMCDADDKLPPFSPTMKYALLTKNHFVTALKLLACGTVTLDNTSDIIRPNPLDEALTRHLEEGVMCEVLGERLWTSDLDAMLAIIGEDNQNASLDMQTNEMEVLQLLSSELEHHRGAKTDPQERYDLVMAKAQTVFGSQSYTRQDLTRLFNFALRVGHQLCKNMSELHFSLINPAFLRCRPMDFGAVAKLDEVSAHCKVALIVSLYLGAAGDKGPGARQQISGVASVCPSLKKETVDSLKGSPGILKTAEDFLKKVLRHYKVDMNRATVKQLLHARARLYYRAGRMLQSWPESEARLQRELSLAETKYSADLVVARAFEKAPPLLYTLPDVEQTIEVTPSKRKEPAEAEAETQPLLGTPVHLDSEGSVAVTPQVEAEMRGVMVGQPVTFTHE